MRSTKHVTVIKHVFYCLLFLLLYIVQTVPGLFQIYGVKPNLLIPAAIALAMFEGEFLGGIYGALAGLLCDMGGVLLFGFNGFLTCLYCIAVGLLIIYLMRCNPLGCVLFTALFMLSRGSLEFLFAYGMWGYENVWKLYLYQTLPEAAYTAVVSPILFWLIRWLYRGFEAHLRN